MKFCIISDTHAKWQKLQIPECDVLISCGDYSFTGEPHLVRNFHEWLNKQDAGYIVSVQGNHETFWDVTPPSRHQASALSFADAKALAESVCPGVYFIDEGAFEIEGVKFYGSAITPWFYSWAWNRHRGDEIKAHWDKIPDDTEILITHGPPAGILDKVYDADMVTVRDEVGCEDLMKRILELDKLKMHCYGHIHSSSGTRDFMDIKFINASICDELYSPTNPVRIFELGGPRSDTHDLVPPET